MTGTKTVSLEKGGEDEFRDYFRDRQQTLVTNACVKMKNCQE